MLPRHRPERPRVRRGSLALLALLAWLPGMAADIVVLHLKNGDRVAGSVLREDSATLTLSNAWAAALSVPLEAIERREPLPSLSTQAPGTPTNSPTAVASATNAPLPGADHALVKGAAPKAPAPKRWKADVNFGLDATFGTSEAQSFFGGASLTYSVPYQQTPQRFFRAMSKVAGNYGQAIGVVSANQVVGSLKTDFDLGPNFYAYNLGGAGYDEVRRINLQWELGPGLGWHALKQPKFVLDFELGGQYLVRDLNVGEDTRSVFLRFGENLTWQIAPRVSFKQNFAYLPQSTQFSDYRVRFDGTLSFGILHNLSLNLTAVNLYDSNPAPGVEPNQLQIRSTLGINF